MSEHTPGEMRAQPYGHNIRLCADYHEFDVCPCCDSEDECNCHCERIQSRNCTVVAEIQRTTNSGTIPDDNAARLALCWNCHDELVAALEGCVDSWGDYPPHPGTSLQMARDQAQSVLAKIREKGG